MVCLLLALFAFGKFTDYRALCGGWGGHPLLGRDLLGTHYVVTQAWTEGYFDVYAAERFLQWQREKGLPAWFPAMYPPLAYLIHLPGRGLTAHEWVWGYFALNHLWVLLTGFLLALCLWPRHGRRAGLLGALSVPILLTSAPSIECLWTGQLNFLLAALMTGIAWAHSAGRPGLVAMLAALGASLKLFPVFFCLLLARRGGRRTWTIFAGSLVALTVPVVLYAGSLEPYTGFFRSLPQLLTLDVHDGNQSLPAALVSCLGDRPWSRTLAALASILLTLLTGSALGARVQNLKLVEAGAVMLLCLLAPGQSWAHYGIYALVAWMLLLGATDMPIRELAPALTAAALIACFGGVICTQSWRTSLATWASSWHTSTISYLILWLLCLVPLVRARASQPEQPAAG